MIQLIIPTLGIIIYIYYPLLIVIKIIKNRSKDDSYIPLPGAKFGKIVLQIIFTEPVMPS